VAAVQVAVAKRAFEDSPHCGDDCAYWQSGCRATLCVVDGLGHGKGAERVAKAALDYAARHLSESLPDLFAGCDQALRGTRGVTMGIAIVDECAGTLTYAGIGNTRITIIGEKTICLHSSYGIVGGGYKRLSPKTVPLIPGDLVILSTDGVAETVDLSGYDKALRADVRWLAEKILEDWCRETDDAAVLVYRASSSHPVKRDAQCRRPVA